MKCNKYLIRISLGYLAHTKFKRFLVQSSKFSVQRSEVVKVDMTNILPQQIGKCLF
jgi:hypothetical protein